MEKIGIDIADTIIDVWPSIMKEAKKFNEHHSNNKPCEDKHLYLPEDIYRWSLNEKMEFWRDYGQALTFSSPLKKGVKETLEYFRNEGFLIYFITAKTEDIYANLESKIVNLLKNNNLLYDDIFTQILNKGEFCFNNNIKYLIDDSFNNCYKATCYGVTSLLISNVYNLDREMKNNMYRINEFADAKKYIKRL